MSPNALEEKLFDLLIFLCLPAILRGSVKKSVPGSFDDVICYGQNVSVSQWCHHSSNDRFAKSTSTCNGVAGTPTRVAVDLVKVLCTNRLFSSWSSSKWRLEDRLGVFHNIQLFVRHWPLWRSSKWRVLWWCTKLCTFREKSTKLVYVIFVELYCKNPYNCFTLKSEEKQLFWKIGFFFWRLILQRKNWPCGRTLSREREKDRSVWNLLAFNDRLVTRDLTRWVGLLQKLFRTLELSWQEMLQRGFPWFELNNWTNNVVSKSPSIRVFDRPQLKYWVVQVRSVEIHEIFWSTCPTLRHGVSNKIAPSIKGLLCHRRGNPPH